MLRLLPICCCLFFAFAGKGWGQLSAKSTRLLFYNVENLFDTQSSPGKADFEFSPGSDKQWDNQKYTRKLDDIARVLSSATAGDWPGLVGLCEIENRTVLDDLVARKALSRAGYAIVHRDSRDRRGIDVALLYRKPLFSLLSTRNIEVGETAKARGSAREMLYAKMVSLPDDTLHLFVAHWPSRTEGEAQTEAKRVVAAKALRQQVDSLFGRNRSAKIIIMGDLNDEPSNLSVHQHLAAKAPKSKFEPAKLYNLMQPADGRGEGTLYHNGQFLMFDQIIVSGPTIDSRKGWGAVPQTATIFRQPWMEYRNPKGRTVPNRTYMGNRYTGGISDHFPVVVELRRR